MLQTLMRKVHDHNIEPTLELGLLPQRHTVLIRDACSIREIHLEERKSGWARSLATISLARPLEFSNERLGPTPA